MFFYIKSIFPTSIICLGLMFSSGCEKNKAAINIDSAASKALSENTGFRIAGCHIFYKGKELPRFTGTKVEQAPTIQSWIDILGDNYVNFDANIFVWKELGFRVFTRRENENKVQTLTIMKHVPEPEHIELERYLKDEKHMQYFSSRHPNYEKELKNRIAEAKNKISIYSRIPHPKPVWFNGAIIEDHFNKEQFNQQMAQYRQKLHEGYQSPLGQGSASDFYEGYSVWRQSSFSKCDDGWGFETLVRIEQKFAPDNVISAINIGPDH